MNSITLKSWSDGAVCPTAILVLPKIFKISWENESHHIQKGLDIHLTYAFIWKLENLIPPWLSLSLLHHPE